MPPNQKRDLLVKYETKADAEAAVNTMKQKAGSLIMSTTPKFDETGRVCFQCVDYEEVDALIGIIKETGGKVKSIEKY